MNEVGYLALAYVLTAAAFGAYLLSLARRQRSLERSLGRRQEGPALGQVAQGQAVKGQLVPGPAVQGPAGQQGSVSRD